MECRICRNIDHNKFFNIEEMRLGIGGSFLYLKCARCGCLQINEYPENIADYYPGNYYSYNSGIALQKRRPYKTFLLSRIALQATGARSTFLGKFLYRIAKGGTVEKIKGSGVGLNDRILEIGSGSGNNLVRLYKYGFNDLTGIDPFIEKDIIYNDRVKVYKKSLSEMGESDYDLILLNHSFEHMPDPGSVLISIKSKLKEGGKIMIAVPIIDTYMWRKYGINWVGLDAPRHYYLHSINSMKILSERAGLKIDNIEYKTDAFQFWASEQYSRGIPLQDENSYYSNKNSKLISKESLRAFGRFARDLDKVHDGGNAVFFLVKSTSRDV